jgi:hypothetical protein
VRLLCQDLATAPNDRGVLVLDDTGDRKDGTATAQWPANISGRWASSTTASRP